MKLLPPLLIVLSLAFTDGLIGCNRAGSGTALGSKNQQGNPELEAAISDLSSKRSDRDAAMAVVAAFEQRAAKGESEMTAVAQQVEQIDRVRVSWGDDCFANLRDVTPTSIENMVRESISFMADLTALSVVDTTDAYQSAFVKYVQASGDLARGESLRLTIIYTHLGMLDKISAVEDKDFRSFLGGMSIGDWIAQGEKVNDLLRQAIADMSTARGDLSTAQQTAPQEVASQLQVLKSRVEAMDQEIVAAESKIKSLGGAP